MPVVEWNINSQMVHQGEKKGRFLAYEPISLGNNYYNVTLVIDDLTLEDTMKFYKLTAFNSLGNTEYVVRISSSATPPSSGLEIGAIVGIVVALALLLLIILLMIFARATNRWCFAGKYLRN